MSLVRLVALAAVVVFCGGFIPVGGCARGCGRAGRLASHEADDIARLGVRGGAVRAGEDLAVSGSRAAEELGVAVSRFHGVSVTSELEGAGLRLSEHQHGEVMDAFDVVQDVAEEVIGQLANGDESDDNEAEANLSRAAANLETKLAAVLSPEQLQQLHARLGTSEQIALRLAIDPARKRGSGSAP